MNWEEKLAEACYTARRPEILALKGTDRMRGIRAFLLEGEPGTGKTALAEAVARVLGAPLVYHLLHSWSDDQELFVGVDVQAAVAGDAAAVRQPGVLAHAAQASHAGQVVVCLDEIDKVQERTENLLLDFLQSGRVPIAPGKHLAARAENLLVFLTSNGTRPLGDPLLRRVRRVKLAPLPAETIERILKERTGLPSGLVRVARKVAYKVANGRTPSIQELERMLLELPGSEDVDDVRLIVAGWIGRHVEPTRADVAPLWAEVKKG